MVKNIHIKLTRSSSTAGPFNIYDQWNNLIAENVSREDLVDGIGYYVDSSVAYIKLVSVGDCAYEKIIKIVSMTEVEFADVVTIENSTGCVWQHLTNSGVYNAYYGAISPYIIEYPFSHPPQDEILQSFKDYTKVYRYIDSGAIFSPSNYIELDDVYFNKMIVYNNQQCSGLLKLVTKPKHNLKEYMSYPKYNADSRSIIFTKSDNFYQVNNIHNTLTDKGVQMFIPSCESLSIDKVLNQSNYTYTNVSFGKSLLRAKDSRIRLMLDDRSDIHMVSQFVLESTMISYK